MGDDSWATNSDGSISDQKDPRWGAALKAELAQLLQSGHFNKAAKLEQLLNYLVDQTLAGNGNHLKSYVVGVDALGKDPDFDPNIDSYPRVQVLRLRKMLEAYYARHEPASDLCIYIPAGKYGVRLARRSRAYPELLLPAHSAEITEQNNGIFSVALTRSQSEDSNEQPAIVSDRFSRRAINAHNERKIFRYVFGALALLATVIGSDYFLKNQRSAVPAVSEFMPIQPPVLLVEKPEKSISPVSQAIADEIYAKLADGIGKSWVVRLLLENPRDTLSPSKPPDYRLETQIGEPQDDVRSLYLRLTDSRNDQLLWSGSMEIDPAKPITDDLGKNIVQFAGPFGAIAAHQTKIAGKNYGQGYSCLLGYFEFLNSQNSNARQQLNACLSVRNGDARLEAVRLALMSFNVVENATPANREAVFDEALSFAHQAIRADPKEVYSHFAMARIYFVTDNCAKGNLHTRYAVEANPYDPIMLAVLGNFADLCGNSEGQKLLERAFALRSPGESYARLSLIMAAIRTRRTDQLPALSAEAEQFAEMNSAYHHLCETLIAAASDDLITARAQWQEFSAASVAPKGTPDEMIRPLILSQTVRGKMIAYLQIKSVLPRKAASAGDVAHETVLNTN